jgi:propanol-preferring alcohol dehydrogenase
MLSMTLSQPAPVNTFPLQLTESILPTPKAGQVRLRISVCGVCHTDLHLVEGEIQPPKYPVTPGHQVVGIIDALGSSVTDFEIGDRVGVPWLFSACGTCEFCMRDEENLCPNARFTGFDVDGGFSEAMLAEARYVLPIPTGFQDEQAAPLLCAGIIGYRSLHKSDLQPGECLGLIGFGASAHLAIQVARYWGCEVMVFTRSKEHRQHAENLGAVWVGGIEDKIPRPLDRAVIFAPVGDLVPAVLKHLRPGGTLAINAIHMSIIPAMAYPLLYGERTIRSVANATYQDGIEFLQLAEKIGIQSSVTVYSLKEANKALLDLKNSRFNGEAVLDIHR